MLEFYVIPEERCDAVKSMLDPVTSCHVYSVQKGKLKVNLTRRKILNETYASLRTTSNLKNILLFPRTYSQPDVLFITECSLFYILLQKLLFPLLLGYECIIHRRLRSHQRKHPHL